MHQENGCKNHTRRNNFPEWGDLDSSDHSYGLLAFGTQADWLLAILTTGWISIHHFISRLILCTSWSWKMCFMSSWPSELAHNQIYCKHVLLAGEWVLDDLLKKIPALYECLLTDVIYVTFICSNIFSFHSFSFLFFFLSFKWGEEFDYEHCGSSSLMIIV